ncbi:hypothetical protein ACOME3_009607 [Neoechinorhynchus agilis]
MNHFNTLGGAAAANASMTPVHFQSIGGSTGVNNANHQRPKRKEVHKFEAKFSIYAINWSLRMDKPFRFAIGSCLDEYQNKLQVVSLREDTEDFVVHATTDHPYPATKVMFIPDTRVLYPDLVATSGDFLRIFRLDDSSIRPEAVLSNNRNNDYCAPLTSFDWNELDPYIIGTSSIDTTCTIWNIETGQSIGNVGTAVSTSSRNAATQVAGNVHTQLIAHEKEVLDIAFSKGSSGRDLFVTAGADGTIRFFDLRHLEHSTIIFEYRSALARVQWNRVDSNFLATFAVDSDEVIILDVRMPFTPLSKLNSHRGLLNAISWAPHSYFHICTAGDDCQALIWDLQPAANKSIPEDPILAYTAQGEINNVQWSSTQPDWIAICYHNIFEMLRV